MNNLVLDQKLGDAVEVSDYVANGSFESLRLNVFTSSAKGYAVLVRLVDHNAGWTGPFSYVDRSSYEYLRKSRLSEGDVVVANVGANAGTVFRVPNLGMPTTLGPNSIVCRPRDLDQVDKTYLYYYLAGPVGQSLIAGIISGSAQPKFNKTSFRQLPISLPPIRQQRGIAEVLGALDDKIAANTKLAKTSADLAQALFAASMRAADHEVALSEVTELLSRGVAPKYSEAEDTVVVLNQKCIRDQRVNLDPARRTIASKVGRNKMLKMDDVLVNSTGQGTLGRVARWTNSDNATVDSHITIVRFDPAKADPVCAGMALLASQTTIEEMGEGSTGQTELSRTELGKLRIRLPERSRQAELGERIASMSEMESALLSENQTLAATRDTLLPQLMSGKLRVKDAEKVLENAGV
ncbi:MULTISPECIES: restriction endonuclease subunit S [Micrococcaceae]|uniref:restriction endonuclease subunit S n=1 Tax=Micrococcaceae TaxID=1268 RepID=UPI001F27C94F|nr:MULTISPECIES: restriction endonuclease subunit S [Micrococcaceae]MDT0168867.1 restriction endonuclease subunit S [Pseudarthrobacter sp. BRE9]UKA73827.1 restriction endonuclease subunit S [Arthrobacter sp. FW306-07-I]